MKKFTIATFLFLALQACSHSSKGELSTDVIRFVESSGRIEIEIKDEEWQKIKSKGTVSEDQDYVSVVLLVDRKIVKVSKGITKSLR